MSRDQSELAFPFEGGNNNGMQPYSGMTLRDYFAAKALQGMCADPSTYGTKATDIVEEAYQLADAMLTERAK